MKRPSEFAPLAAHNSDYCLDASPDGETRCELCDQCAEVIEAAQSDARAGMVPEAELAKAWEAGRDAAAFESELGCVENLPQRIRALQPPGGKAR